jgi:hypothetical protein
VSPRQSVREDVGNEIATYWILATRDMITFRFCFCGCVGIDVLGLVYRCWCLGIGVLRLVSGVRVSLGRKAVQVSGNSDLIYLLSHE